jgi:hypothetical protein
MVLSSCVALGCGSPPESFQCSADAQCVDGAEHGLCEADGHCSFPDGACRSGRRYVHYGGD